MLSARSTSLSSVGHQRFWYWRGWQIRYWFQQPLQPEAQTRPPLLLIHGFGANLNQWRHNLQPLSQHYPVYALDLLGFGDSEKAATDYGATLWATQVETFIRTVIGQPVLLVGHSLGALVALTTAINAHDLVSRLVLVTLPLSAEREDLVAGWVGTLARRVEAIMSNPLLLRPLFRAVRRPSLLRSVLKQIYTRPELVDDELVETFALPPQQRGAARTLCYLVRSRTQADFSPSIKQELRQLAVPTLLLWGESDRVVPIQWASALTATNPQIQLQGVPDGGHCLYDEEPQDFNHRVLQWLADDLHHASQPALAPQ